MLPVTTSGSGARPSSSDLSGSVSALTFTSRLKFPVNPGASTNKTRSTGTRAGTANVATDSRPFVAIDAASPQPWCRRSAPRGWAAPTPPAPSSAKTANVRLNPRRVCEIQLHMQISKRRLLQRNGRVPREPLRRQIEEREGAKRRRLAAQRVRAGDRRRSDEVMHLRVEIRASRRYRPAPASPDRRQSSRRSHPDSEPAQPRSPRSPPRSA